MSMVAVQDHAEHFRTEPVAVHTNRA